MKRNLIRYKTHPERSEENQRRIEDVFAELRAKAPAGVRYLVLRDGDGGFVHLVETEEGSAGVPALDAFRAFQSGIRDRCIEPPRFADVTIVGNYRMIDE
jgi:radical SAM superfamily enzyme with C-terminal helix-hairpin-helix motif